MAFLKNLFVGVVVLALLAVAFFGWNIYSSLSTAIANPTDQPITFQLDGKDITIPANTTISQNIFPGTHSVTFSGKTESFSKPWFKMLGSGVGFFETRKTFLNPTRSFYIVEAVEYTTGASSYNIDSSIKFDGKLYSSAYNTFLYEFSGLYTEVDYLPGEKEPEEVSVSSSAKNAKLYKMYSKDEFLKTVAEEVDTKAKYINIDKKENQQYTK